jgi:hypothetical protein
MDPKNIACIDPNLKNNYTEEYLAMSYSKTARAPIKEISNTT